MSGVEDLPLYPLANQEVELSFRDLADSCLLLVDRELQLAHDLAQLLQRLVGIAFLTGDQPVCPKCCSPLVLVSFQSERGMPDFSRFTCSDCGRSETFADDDHGAP